MERKKAEKKTEKKTLYESTLGRPPKEIKKEIFEGLCRVQCTETEICAVLGVSQNTLLKFCKENYDGATFCEVSNIFREAGKVSLRHTQFQQAKKSPKMAMWLGKQYLGQQDTVTIAAEQQQLKKLEEILAGMKKIAEEDEGEES